MQFNNFVVGLTGGIGSGKSTVADLFAKLNVTVIDTDKIARNVIKKNTNAYHQIIKKFGNNVLSAEGDIDRRALRDLVFENSNNRIWLEELIHPLIRQNTAEEISKSTSTYCIVVIPLLFETKPNPLINRVLVVDAPEELQLQRASTRDNYSIDKIKSIMKTQLTREERLNKADDVIHNDNEISDLIPQVEKLHKLYTNLATNASLKY